jgi:hypothetical protein
VVGGGVTQAASRATLPVLRVLLDHARGKDYRSGVLGVRARPEWTGAPTFMHADVPVRVVTCVSALAVHEAIRQRISGQWLVVLTDRADDDLGTGLLSHFLFNRLRTPDPWEAVLDRFAASGIDPALTAMADDRAIAIGLLVAAPPGGWPPAPGGVLTRDHALGAVAAAQLDLTDPVVDVTSVLAWTADPGAPTRVADLRALAGDGLASAVLDWTADRAGAVGGPLLRLLRGGDARDAIPLGLVAGLLSAAGNGAGGTADGAAPSRAESMRLAREGLIRLEPRLGGTAPAPATLQSWAADAAAVIAGLLRDAGTRASGMALLARADELLAGTQAGGLAEDSDLLPSGLTRRFAALAGALRAAAASAAARGFAEPDLPQVREAGLGDVEREWTRVAVHRLAEDDARTTAFHAAVRLARWLAAPAAAASGALPVLIDRHTRSDAWADSAVNDASPGVSDPELGAGLAAVLAAARARRTAHDGTFAAALAAHTSSDPGAGPGHEGVRHLEDLLPRVILPLVASAPFLLLVLDGMSAGVGAEVVASVLGRAGEGWAEALLPGQAGRAAALAVLPTLTEVSRASLLCGELRTGGQDAEKRGYDALIEAHRVPRPALFHKKPLDSARLGYAVADDVAAAIADVTRYPLVTCILNTIDDALDRSDPGGTEWGTDAVKHLAPLLERARQAGRVVVLTADHGHIVERRQGTQRAYAAISSGRSRAADQPAGDGEVLIAGRRVLKHEGRAVLAVDEQLRYGPLKAGYHGGGAPAEAIVPVIVLVPGAVPEGLSLELAPPQEPAWWIDPAAPPSSGPAPPQAAAPAPARAPAAAARTRPRDAAPTLFDEAPGTGSPAGVAAAGGAGPSGPLAATVVKSAAYAAQKKVAGRVSVTDDQVRALLGALLDAPGNRLVPARAATALTVSPVLLRGAVLHVQRLLNVEGYPVLRVDADGTTLILDEDLLREQFGIRP